MCPQTKVKNDKYENIVICNYNTRNKIDYCNNLEEYHELIKRNPSLSELIGGTANIKPIFDIDAFENDIDINKEIKTISNIFPNKEICFAKRDPRTENCKKQDCIKYSYRAYVQDTQISYDNLKYLCKYHKLIDDKKYDMSIYSKNHILFLPHTTQKIPDSITKKTKIVPELLPLDNADVFQCSASYIREDFEDWNIKVDNIKQDLNGKNLLKFINDNNDLIETTLTNETNEKATPKPKEKATPKPKEKATPKPKEKAVPVIETPEEILKKYLEILKPTRFEPFETWLPVMLAIINVGLKHNISKINVRVIIHNYSALADNYNDEKVDNWFETTYNKKKCDKGYGIPYILQCVKEDDIEWYNTNIGMTYDNIKKEFDTRVFKCNDPIGFVEININQNELNPSPYYILSRSQVIEKYEDLLYFEKNEKDKVVKKSFTARWLKDPTKKSYHNIVFLPKKLSPEMAKNHFNLFKGFRAESLPVFKDYNLIKPILDHIFIVLSKSRHDVYNFIMQWFAQIIRNPCIKTQVFIILKSEPGSGKNIILDMIGKKIIGDYAVDTASPERVFFGTFNSLMCNKLLVVCNEAGSGLRDCIDRIKDVITAPTINIEKKGKDPIVFDNHINSIKTTNNRAPIPIPPEDRRMTLFECSMEKKGNTEYFNKLGELCEDDKAISSFYHYLLEEVEITIKNFQKDRPITEEYKKVQQLHIPNCVSYMININDTLNWKLYKGKSISILKITDLYKKYKTYCEDCKITSYSKKNFLFDIVCGRSGILKCTHDGYDCIRLLKPEYEAWIAEYTSLECEVDEENYDGIEFLCADDDDEE